MTKLQFIIFSGIVASLIFVAGMVWGKTGACSVDWMTAYTGLSALGTIAVAIMAIWGEWIRTTFVGPKLRISEFNFRGTVTDLNFFGPQQNLIGTSRAIYYHLEVRNLRSWAPAKDCRVMLRELYRKGSDGAFNPVRVVVPVQYVWTPSEWSPALQTITDTAVFDFGRLTANSGMFEPTLYVTGGDFNGFIRGPGFIRYGLQIVAENAKPSPLQFFEVVWNGQWSENLDEMALNLRIREIESNAVLTAPATAL